MNNLSIIASGMVTAVGLDARSSCAAIRCAIDNFSETRFKDKSGECIVGSQVSLERQWRGISRLVHLAAPAIKECLTHVASPRAEEIPLLLCVAEKERPGRLEGLDDQLREEIEAALGIRFHSKSSVIAEGSVGIGTAMQYARELIHQKEASICIVAGVDSLLVASTLLAFEEKDRLLTDQNSNGFIPGEAGAAVLVGLQDRQDDLVCHGIGRGHERATFASEEPLRADGLVEALRAAFADAGCDYAAVDFRICDANGEQYWFKEAALAMARTLRVRKEQFDIWHPADCVGEIGAACGPCALGVALAAARKAYAPGSGILCHFGCDNGQRTALVLHRGDAIFG